MANEVKTEQEKVSTSSNVRALQDSVAALPRTDHMTLPAIQVTLIDDETVARMQMISDINNSTSPEDTLGDEGLTVGDVQNQFMYGVTDMNEEAGKHEIIIGESESGQETVTIVPPVHEVVNARGETEEVQGEPVVIEATPPNIAPVDVDAPKDPVAAREAAGLAEDGSEGDPVGGTAPINTTPSGAPTSAPFQPSVKPATADQNMGSVPKVGGSAPVSGTPASGSVNPSAGGSTPSGSGSSGGGTGNSGGSNS